jgi:hypothetical protein
VYALHAARALKTHIMTPAQWDAIAHRARQADLFRAAPAPRPAAAPKAPRADDGDHGFGNDDWVIR